MELYRNELINGFSNQEYSLVDESFDFSNLQFFKPEIICKVSCKSESQGFKLDGSLEYTLLLKCDRCLNKFKNTINHTFKFLLTSKHDLLKKKNEDVILFTDDMNMVDISSYLKDLIYLSKPIKILCKEGCEGLCSVCGTNLNKDYCNCKNDRVHTPFEKLSHLTSN